MNDEVERLLAAFAAPTAGLARHLCEHILALFPDAVITGDSERIGFGTDTGYKGLVFTVAPYQTHVTLGVANATDLPDPTGLLQGTGKVHRHIKIRSESDLTPDLTTLLTTALTHHPG
ncbi:DUF1801 domain-containing protein [Streptosporangiaceae bacterium NEAU-GS5]|nr:DUF1801 domain-containing protein [Streptosporangiaceae bacterium NEAU-GS5]